MTPADMARLHAAAFVHDRGWSEAEFADLLRSPFVKLHKVRSGFALTRTIADESELLTIAVHPEHQRRGIGRLLLNRWLDTLAGSGGTAFLEVAADNTAACTLYRRNGFVTVATRRGYYARKGAAPIDAYVMRHGLTHGHPANSP